MKLREGQSRRGCGLVAMAYVDAIVWPGARHALRQFITRREDQVARAQCRALSRGGADAATIRLHSRDLDRSQESGASAQRDVQEACRQSPRIGREAAVTKQAMPACDTELRRDLARREVGDFEAGAAARGGLLAQGVGIEERAVQIEGTAIVDVGIDAQMLDALAQAVERQPGPSPHPLRPVEADVSCEMRERCVDLVLHERSGGRCGTRDRRTPVDDQHVEAGIAQRIGDHRATDAGADDDDVGRGVAPQDVASQARQSSGMPYRTAGPQVPVSRGAHCSCLTSDVTRSARQWPQQELRTSGTQELRTQDLSGSLDQGRGVIPSRRAIVSP